MSDIGFYGLEAALVSLAMLAVAGGGFFGEVLLWRKRHEQGESLAFALAAPLVYGFLALAILYMSEQGSLDWKSTVDDSARPIAGVGLLLWGAVRISMRARGRHRGKW